MTKPKQGRRLIYDIETCLLSFYSFHTGKQFLGHNQLIPGKSRHQIICITYCWDNEPVQTLKWEPEGRQEKLIKDFDAIIQQADVAIGKNSDRFDTKMINGIRIFTDQPGMPDWTKYTDDLEKQMRKHFRLPSQSLDYISRQFGLGGKVPMQFEDWVLIDQWMTVLMLRDDGIADPALDIYCQHMYRDSLINVLRKGQKAFDKMCKYGAKDTRDTRTLWNKLSKHFEPKFSAATFNNKVLACDLCGSSKLGRNDVRSQGKTLYQRFRCNNCGYRGTRRPLRQVERLEGKL